MQLRLGKISIHSGASITCGYSCAPFSTLSASSPRFLYDGNRINEEDTPATLDMENDDTIDVMVEREFSVLVGFGQDAHFPHF